MREHHSVDESDALRQPGRSQMGAGVQNVDGKEDQAEIVLGDSESAEEPVGD